MKNLDINTQDTARNFLRYYTPDKIFQLGAQTLNFTQTIKKYGFDVYRKLYFSKKLTEVVHFKNFPYPLYFRPGTSDVNTIVQNIVREEYGQLPKSFSPYWIIDGGAYIGDVSIYYLNRYKNCQIVALEPDVTNFSLAKQNLEMYSENLILIHKGLWSHVSKLHLTGSYTNASFINNRSGFENARAIEVIDIETIMKQNNILQIDILKLDVEGAEKQILLRNNKYWLDKVKYIIVEFHGKEIEMECNQFLLEHGFQLYCHRSLHYYSKNL